MFQSALLRSALVALAIFDRVAEADASPEDIANYPLWNDKLVGAVDFNW